jgi:flagellar basal-body rod protein FlgF
MNENVTYIALSQQLALARQLAVVANNVANMSTTAYKSERVLFEEFLVATDAGSELSFVQDVAVARDLQEGEMRATGNPLDLAISGRGYFVVETPEGPRYTRNGHFRLSSEGTLVTQDGFPVLDAQGRPVEVRGAEAGIDVSSDGTVTLGGGQATKLQLVGFANEYNLRPIGSGLYETEEAPQPAPKAAVLQGMLESSNVVPILEITQMIELSRAYEATQRLLESGNDLSLRTIRRLAQVA